jgi:predicted O-linked N-acetylglucosamine transferase (SPINDLY family)
VKPPEKIPTATTEDTVTNLVDWQQQAHQYLVLGDYSRAASLYEEAITAEPEIRSYYWHFGLMLLLQGEELEAQTTWLFVMAEGEPEEVELWTAELMEVLHKEASRTEELESYSVAWALRQHMKEINPTDVNNLLHLVELTINLDNFTDEQLASIGITELLKSGQLLYLDTNLLLKVLKIVFQPAFLGTSVLEMLEASLTHIQNPRDLLTVLLPAAIRLGYSEKCPHLAARLLELYSTIEPDYREVLVHLSCLYQNSGQYDKGIETAKHCNSLPQTFAEKIYGYYLVLRGLMTAGGYWQEACEVGQQQEALFLSLIKEQPILLEETTVQRLFSSTYFLPYLQDDPKQNRYIQNQITQICQFNIRNDAKEQTERYANRVIENRALLNSPPNLLTKAPATLGGTGDTNSLILRKTDSQSLPELGDLGGEISADFDKFISVSINAKNRTKPLKIGYLSHCLKSHSVGWLARWVFKYHDRENFQIYSYLINYSQQRDPLQEWYLNQSDQVYKAGSNGLEIAEKIYQDEIDILIDLDSITLDTTCKIMCLKPAPIQVTWLGWDASGIPAIDYFIADPYVLPESAQDYYSEKIWRLPQTYIAVDGFEVSVPNLRRDHIDIPSDAVVYLCPQRGYKLNTEIARLQLKIIKEVPNSYFLIKGLADKGSIKNFFTQIAEEEGVDCDRLRFLPDVALEAVHRANLGIVDIVLDTYPYNGATTTLETLWMCIPLVTRVGQQFAARNSYTMMMNAGITEGISWTDEEYVEWGIRLGKDAQLRQQIALRLKQSRQTSPLWNGKQFTREMENAYEQMWQRYMES